MRALHLAKLITGATSEPQEHLQQLQGSKGIVQE